MCCLTECYQAFASGKSATGAAEWDDIAITVERSSVYLAVPFQPPASSLTPSGGLFRHLHWALLEPTPLLPKVATRTDELQAVHCKLLLDYPMSTASASNRQPVFGIYEGCGRSIPAK